MKLLGNHLAKNTEDISEVPPEMGKRQRLWLLRNSWPTSLVIRQRHFPPLSSLYTHFPIYIFLNNDFHFRILKLIRNEYIEGSSSRGAILFHHSSQPKLALESYRAIFKSKFF